MIFFRVWRSFFNYFKINKLDAVIFFYCIGGVYLIPTKIACKNFIMAFLAIILVVFSCTQEKRLKQYFFYFVRDNNETKFSKLAGFIALLAIFSFIVLLLSANVFTITLTFWNAIIFAVLILSSCIITIFDLENKKNTKAIAIRVAFFTLLPLLYTLTSSYAASLFLQISNMIITISPWLEYCWKVTAFLITFSMLSQPFCYGLFISFGNNAKGYRIVTLVGAVITTSFLLLLMPKLAGGIAYFVLNNAINYEWRDNAKCGQLIIKNPWEKYYGFNTEKYTVFYSFRNEKWGFEELTCHKRTDGSDYYTIEGLPQNDIPKWLR